MEREKFIFEVILRHISCDGIYPVNTNKDKIIKGANEVWEAIRSDSINRNSGDE